jgi:hypothetical protein
LDWIELVVIEEADNVVKYPVTVDKVGTRRDDRIERDDTICAFLVVINVVSIELVTIVEPVREVKYPVTVERVGTNREDRIVKEDVTCAS